MHTSTILALRCRSFRTRRGETTLLDGKPGKVVNLENDVVGKYVEKLLAPYKGDDVDGKLSNGKASNRSGLDMKFLVENGFM